MLSYLIIFFQRSIVIIVATILPVVTNMHAYSFMGSYETSSQAIMVSNEYEQKNPKAIERPLVMAQLVAILITGFVIGSTGLPAIEVALLAATASSVALIAATPNNHIDTDFHI